MCQSVRVTAVLGNGFPPGGTKAEATHRSAPTSLTCNITSSCMRGVCLQSDISTNIIFGKDNVHIQS